MKLSGTNSHLQELTSSSILWKYFYERDFKTEFPSPSSFAPQHMYYIRSISSFRSIDRGKTFNNIRCAPLPLVSSSNVMQRAVAVESLIKTKFTIGVWEVDFDVGFPSPLTLRESPDTPSLKTTRGLASNSPSQAMDGNNRWRNQLQVSRSGLQWTANVRVQVPFCGGRSPVVLPKWWTKRCTR